MSFQQHITLDNILKVVLAIAVGVLLYTIFFKKTEGYYNYRAVDEIVGPHAYPMDYEDEPAEEYYPETEVVDDVGIADTVVDEVVLDKSADEELYEYEQDVSDPYDDSADDAVDAVDHETEIPDEIYEEADSEETAEDSIQPYQAYDFLYASDGEGDLQEHFVMYENNVGVDTTYT